MEIGIYYIKIVEYIKIFVDGKWLYHPQLRGIAMNMQMIEGGAKRYKEIIKKIYV